MAKMQYSFKLVAVDKDGTPVRSDNCVTAVRFTDGRNNFFPNGVLQTPKGEYRLVKHPSLNIFQGTCAGIKVQVSIKKMVGAIQAWY